MEKITPHLWFDKEAKEAAELYTSAFEHSKIKDITVLHDTPSGTVDIVTIELAGQEFQLLNAGPLFKFTPAISFFVQCTSKEEVDALWAKLADGGTPLMELGEYPFSERYGWTQDRYGLSWQIGVMGGPVAQKITPVLMFTGAVCGKAEEAIRFYASVFDDANVGDILRYETGEDPDKPGTIKWASFQLEGEQFGAMDSARAHDFTFNEAVSLIVHCENQAEIDRYWAALSAVPEAEQCGWLKDRYGVSWQIVPRAMDRMVKDKDEQKLARLTEAFLKMKKFDIAALERAYEG